MIKLLSKREAPAAQRRSLHSAVRRRVQETALQDVQGAATIKDTVHMKPHGSEMNGIGYCKISVSADIAIIF